MITVGKEYVNIKKGYIFSKQELNRKVSVDAVYKVFSETHRMDALRCEKVPDRDWQPHYFWDSDVAKWIECASYVIAKNPDKSIEERIEKIIDDIEANQCDDGYINCYYTVVEPDKRFANVLLHELYCIGHYIEAAIAYFEATGKDRLLGIICRSVELVKKVFVEDESADFAFPGHQQIELALYKLYKFSGNKEYLELARHFLEKRGVDMKGFPEESLYSLQAYAPVAEQKEAIGHSVRMMYMYCAMADVASEGDDKYIETLKKGFDDIINGKMYVTGGIGQIREYEGFVDKYYLPNERAYAETCAGIGLIFLCDRMLKLFEDAKYADVLERVFYNNVLSGISLSGDAFFYENPLAMNPQEEKMMKKYNYKKVLPKYERAKVFDCSCCPPNISRLIGTFEQYLYYTNGECLFVNQYAESEYEKDGATLSVKTNYPLDGKVEISSENVKKLALRIPEWCDSFEILEKYTVKNGYAIIENPSEKIEANFEMKPKIVFANGNVRDCAGKCCITYGPIVYCAEGIDNEGTVHEIFVSSDAEFKRSYNEEFGLNTLSFIGEKIRTDGDLYSSKRPILEKAKITLIPYSTFANRGASDMQVWLGYKF